MLPHLRERERNLGANLSGGEQQMLAIGRALMTNPQPLIRDEAAQGLAPLMRNEIWSCLKRLRDAGLSMIDIDKQICPLTALADRHYILQKAVSSGRAAATSCAQPQVLQRYVGV